MRERDTTTLATTHARKDGKRRLPPKALAGAASETSAEKCLVSCHVPT
jgi:hypothetical protein